MTAGQLLVGLNALWPTQPNFGKTMAHPAVLHALFPFWAEFYGFLPESC